MNLDLIRPKNELEYLLLSTFQHCESLFDKTYKKPQETLEFTLTQPKNKFSFQPPIALCLDSKWMIGLTKLVKHTFNLEKTTEKNKLEFYTDFLISFLPQKKEDELQEILSISCISPKRLRDQNIGPLIIITNQKPSFEKRHH